MVVISMQHRQTQQLRAVVVLLAVVLSFGSRITVVAAPKHAVRLPRPNVVLVMTDDQGFGDLGLHGNKLIRTPHLDRFARGGIEFTRFYCSPVCAPTRASLMTGRYYYRSGVVHTSRGGAKMHGEETTLAESLARVGYHTGIFGKWHLGDNYPMRPQDQGFQETLVHKSGGIDQPPDVPNSYFNPLLWRNGKRFNSKGYCTDVFFDAAIQFIEQHREEPFFVYLPTNAPHTPLQVSRQYSDRYKAKGLSETTAHLYGMVENIDDNFGRLLKTLDRLKLREKTVVIFFSDNGPQQKRYNTGLRGRKSQTYEGGIRVPCFVQWSGVLSGKRQIDRIAAHIDIAPTILSLCAPGTVPSRPFDGQSLLPLLTGKTRPADWPDRTLYFQVHRGLIPKRYQNCAAVTQRFKLVGYPGTFSRENLATSDKPVLELYDLIADPGEKTNLAARRPRIVQNLKCGYESWFADVAKSRRFIPGVIHIGNPAENPTHLCRYQDGTYRDGVSRGWSVRIERKGRYQVTIHQDQNDAGGVLSVQWQGRTLRRPVSGTGSSAVFDLTAGAGPLDVWFVKTGQKRAVLSSKSIVGDVDIERLD